MKTISPHDSAHRSITGNALFLLALLALLPLAGCGTSPFQGDLTVTQVGGGDPVLTGRVLTLAGGPAAGVTVTLQRNVGTTGVASESAVTDDQGAYRFSAQEPITQTSAVLYVDFPGYAGEPDSYRLSNGTGAASGLNFVLHKLVEVSGTLLVNDGTTVPPPIRINFNRSGIAQRTTLSDGVTGGYAVALKEAIEYAIVPTQTENFLCDPTQRVLTPGADGAAGQDFSLTRLAYSISGAVRYSADNSPVWGRSVIATGNGGYKAGHTNQEGDYRIDGLGRDTYTVSLESGGGTPPSRVIQIIDRDAVNANFLIP